MVEFNYLKSIQIQLHICFNEGKYFTHSKQSSPLLCSQLTARPKAAVLLLLGGYPAICLRVLRTAEQEGRGGLVKYIMDVTDVDICWACLSALRKILETFN